MATVRPRVMRMPERQEGRTGRVVDHNRAARKTIVTKVLSSCPTATEKSHLAYADIVVAGGLGLQSGRELPARRGAGPVLGAEWGGSRPLRAEGVVPADRQIGQTGKTIRPKL